MGSEKINKTFLAGFDFSFPTVNQKLLKVSYLKYMKMNMAKRRDMMETE